MYVYVVCRLCARTHARTNTHTMGRGAQHYYRKESRLAAVHGSPTTERKHLPTEEAPTHRDVRAGNHALGFPRWCKAQWFVGEQRSQHCSSFAVPRLPTAATAKQDLLSHAIS